MTSSFSRCTCLSNTARFHECFDQILTTAVFGDATLPASRRRRVMRATVRITFNIHPQTEYLNLGNEWLLFSAFRRQQLPVEIPATAVLTVYVRETGRGIFFKARATRRPPVAVGIRRPWPGDEPPPSLDKPPPQKVRGLRSK